MPHALKTATPTRAEGPLCGWVQKKHESKAGYGKRYLYIDEDRGRLHVQKDKGKEGGNVFSLDEISVQESLATDSDGRCFTISASPLHVTLRAESELQLRMWVDGLRRRAEEWRRRRHDEHAELGIAVASPLKSPGGVPSARASTRSPDTSPPSSRKVSKAPRDLHRELADVRLRDASPAASPPPRTPSKTSPPPKSANSASKSARRFQMGISTPVKEAWTPTKPAAGSTPAKPKVALWDQDLGDVNL